VAGKNVFSTGMAEGPIGMIFPFRGKPPKGWLPFDGRTITKEQHPELFKLANWSDFGDIRLEMVEPYIPALRGTSSIKPLMVAKANFGDGIELFSQTG
jgi:hypothetical protein